MGITNDFLIRFYVYQTGENSGELWYWKPDQKPVTREIIGISGGAAAVVLLNCHDMPVKLSSI